jgi:GH15 family glucan-1,4-alpha-glucosidase
MIDFSKTVKNKEEVIAKILEKSREVLIESQFSSGGTAASLKGSRYAGNTYPRDHAYATRAFIALGENKRAKDALEFILNCPLSSEKIMHQRYNEKGKDNSYKPPQMDGNAQTLVSVAEYYKKTHDIDFINHHKNNISDLVNGIVEHIHHFPHGDLIYTINGIIEFSPFEQGYEIYTNACVYRALKDIAELYRDCFKDDNASKLSEKAELIKKGIGYYLYFPHLGGFMSCMRGEPDSSIVQSPNLKSFLALTDFNVFAADDPKIETSLQFHLKGTKNTEVGGYNRYSNEIGRHNFGNGPWPMVMLRLADYYRKKNDKKSMEEVEEWVLNVALENLDIPFGLPEHVVSKKTFKEMYEAALVIDDISPRPAKIQEYISIEESKMFKEKSVAYPINPLVWSHAQFILFYRTAR